MWYRIRRKRKRASTVTKHYQEHKEMARALLLARLHHYNQHYGYTWNRVAIRNQRRCWGSCTSLKNLNFSYKLLFIPAHLRDYVIVHELCHLEELNHGKSFWTLVEQQLPNYRELRKELRVLEREGTSYVRLEKLKLLDKNDVVEGINV